MPTRPKRVRTVEPVFPMPWVIGGVVAMVAGALVLFGVSRTGSAATPAACSPLLQSLDQMTGDLNTALQASRKGTADPVPLQNDLASLQAVISANPGPIGEHGQPVFDAMTQLMADVQGKIPNQTADLAAVSHASLSALTFCGVKPSTAPPITPTSVDHSAVH